MGTLGLKLSPQGCTIERCGGTLENVVENPEGGPRKCRYWIA